MSRRKTADERRAEALELHQKMQAEVEALVSSDRWRRFLAAVASFHRYSFTNVLLILAQRPDATEVAGYRAWQKLGRQVRKGEKSIRIRGFRTRTITTTNDLGEEEDQSVASYPLVSVFDRSQTDLIEGAEDVTSPPVQLLAGDDHHGVADRITGYLTGQGWTVSREPIPGAVNGYTTTDGTRRIVVDADLSPAAAAKTLLHEAAHATLHSDIDPGAYVAHRGTVETEAESVAYILAAMAGLDASEYSIGYVAGWSEGDTDLIRSTADNVMSAVATLAPAIEPTSEPVGAVVEAA